MVTSSSWISLRVGTHRSSGPRAPVQFIVLEVTYKFLLVVDHEERETLNASLYLHTTKYIVDHVVNERSRSVTLSHMAGKIKDQ